MYFKPFNFNLETIFHLNLLKLNIFIKFKNIYMLKL